MTKTLLSVAAFAAALGGASVPAYAQHRVIVAPPPPPEEVVPATPHGWHWVPGYWNWNGHRYVWAKGAWVRDRAGWRYADPHWEQHDGHWVFMRGGWGHGDHDHDGVPDFADHHPYHPYRR